MSALINTSQVTAFDIRQWDLHNVSVVTLPCGLFTILIMLLIYEAQCDKHEASPGLRHVVILRLITVEFPYNPVSLLSVTFSFTTRLSSRVNMSTWVLT